MAGDAGKPELFKFRAYTTPAEVSRVREIIQRHKIFFAKRSQLNDPYDLAPAIELGGSLADPAFHKDLVADATKQLASNGVDSTEIVRRVALMEKQGFSSISTDGQAAVLKRLEDQYPVFSLAGQRDHPLMWAHYANGHSGLCIHFRGDGNSYFGTAQEVGYHLERAVIHAPIALDEDELIAKAVLWKGVCWAHEEEFRLIKYPDVDLSGAGVNFDGQVCQFDPNLLSGISVGEVKCLAKEHSPSLPVWQANLRNDFALGFDRIF
jgi:hypothetical protein